MNCNATIEEELARIKALYPNMWESLPSDSDEEIRKEKRKMKKKKGRQGRSFEVRRRRELEKKLQAEYCKEHETKYKDCMNCGSKGNFVEDHHSGDLICQRCAAINESHGLASSNHVMMGSLITSKKYVKITHFRERVAQFRGNDPEQPEEVILKIRVQLESERTRYGPTWSFGYKTFSNILKDCGLDSKLASHWIQFRRRLGFNPVPENIPEDILHRIIVRFNCVAIAFAQTIHISTPSEVAPCLKRKNIMNINYVFMMLARLEDESFFKHYAKYFPQLISPSQPKLNNERWELIVDYCKTHFRTYATRVKQNLYYFDWEYKPLLETDLVKYFYYFD